jgi:nicotinamidase-related amidase
MSRTALFVIDIQNSLANSTTEIPHASRIRQAAETILKTVRGRSSPESRPDRFIVQHEESPESGDLVRGTESWELVFSPRGDDERLLSKHTRTPYVAPL